MIPYSLHQTTFTPSQAAESRRDDSPFNPPASSEEELYDQLDKQKVRKISRKDIR